MPTVKKIFKTVWVNALLTVRYGVFYPVIPALLIGIIYYIVTLKRTKVKAVKKSALFGFTFYFYICPFWLAVISRIDREKVDSTAHIFDGWFVRETGYFFDILAFQNVFLFTPFAVCLALFVLKYKQCSNKSIVLICTLMSFAMSLVIELIQLVTCIGTFQISDLVYNTLGGLIGAVIVLVVKMIYKKRKHFE